MLSLLAAGPAFAKNTAQEADSSVTKKIDALDALLGGLDGRANKAHKAFGTRNSNVVNGIFGKAGAKQVFGKDTLALLTGKDGLKGTLGKDGPLAKSQSLLGSLRTDYKKMGDTKKLKTVTTMQSRLKRIKSTTNGLASARTLLMGTKTQKQIVGLRKDLKAMRKDTRSLKK